MNGNIVQHIQALGEAGVATLADTKSFLRGDAIDPRDVDALQFTGEEFCAQVMGTNPYLVKVWLELDDGAEVADRLTVHCTCPVRPEWCKHAVAVALRMMKDPEWARSAPTGEVEVPDVDSTRRYGDVEEGTEDVVTSTLGIMNKQDLVNVINELRGMQPLIEPFVSKLVLPYSSQPFPGLHEIQTQIENTRIMFEIAHTDDGVVDAADQLLYTGNLIRSYAGGDFNRKLLAALETLMFEANRWALAIALPVGPIVHALEQLHQHHVAMMHWEQPDASHVIDWLLDSYFAPGWHLPAQVKEYADMLDEDDLVSLIQQAHERRPLHPEVVLPLEIDVALIRNDIHALKRLCDARGLHNGLIMYYVHNSMEVETQELVAAALDVDDPVTISAEMLYLATVEYFGDDGLRMYHRYWFHKDPSLENFRDFMQVPGVDFADAVFALQSVEEVAGNPDYTVLAATVFQRFDIGFEVITTGDPSAQMAADFASSVGMTYDPVWAMGVVFARIEEEFSRVLRHHSSAVIRASMSRLMEQIILVRKEAEKVAGEASISADWHAHVNALKREFGDRPAVKAAFTDWDL